MPSRDFLLKQAIMNWCKREYPQSTANSGVAYVLNIMTGYGGYIRKFDAEEIVDEYRNIYTREMLIERGIANA